MKLFSKKIKGEIHEDDLVAVKDVFSGQIVNVKASTIINQVFNLSSLGDSIDYEQEETQTCGTNEVVKEPLGLVDALLKHEELLCQAQQISDEIQNTCCDGYNPLSTYYYFQFDSVSQDINDANLITDDFLNQDASVVTEQDLEAGIELSFTVVGRIGFAVRTEIENNYTIFDELNNDITTEVFDTVYDSLRNIQIYITKEFYTPNNIFFKFTKKS